MKRMIAILAVMVMCLSLCACGKSEPDSVRYQKYQAIIDSLENGNYQNAIDLIENMAKQDDPTPNMGNTTESTKPALTPEQLAWQADAVGTWIPGESAKEDGHTGFVIRTDSTCVVDGKNYTWEIGDSSKNSAQITVLDGEEKAHMLQLYIDSEYGYKKASLFTYTNPSTSQGTNGNYYRNEDYTVLEITNDNWQDYFEIKEVIGTDKNAFGEIDQFRSSTIFRLKDTYGKVNAYLSTDALECKYITTCQDITVDLTNMTYKVVGKVRNAADRKNITEMHYTTDASGAQYFGASIGGFTASDWDENMTDTVWRPTDIEIVRVQATLYIIKK